MRFNKYILLIFSAFGFLTSFGQEDNGQSPLILVNIEFGYNLPAGDYSNRFGGNLGIGGGVQYMTKKNLIYGIQGTYHFGNEVKEDPLSNIRNEDGFLIGNNKIHASIFLRQRALFVGGNIGKLISLSKVNPRSGLRLMLDVGYFQHKIRIQEDPNSFVPIIAGDYKKGWDKMSNGFSLRQFVGYQNLSLDGLLNFYVGFEFMQAFTQNRRMNDFQTFGKLEESRFDMMVGVKTRVDIAISYWRQCGHDLLLVNMIWLYNFSITLYGFIIWLASFFNEKAALWIDGRKGLFEKLESQLEKSSPKKAPIIWMHVASLGEFEQGRPIIESLKQNYPDYKIFLTFFSPSGYEIRKNYELADYIFYLPMDTKKNAQKFIEIIQPRLVIFVKYEFWYHFLNTLQSKNIPTILVSALFRPDQLFFKSYGALFRKILKGFDHIFLQNEASFELLKSHGYRKISLTGDSRIDRVAAIAKQAKSFEIIDQFANDSQVLVCGSTWPPDESILEGFIKNAHEWKFIIAPHEIKESNIERLQNLLPQNAIRYSKANSASVKTAKILIIDNIGMLSSLYRYGKIAYIGGGFGAGIHNTLEPIAFGLPVIFGPKYKKFDEALVLVEKKGAFSVNNSADFESIMQKMTEKSFYKNASQEAQNYINQNRGATEKIIKYISKIL